MTCLSWTGIIYLLLSLIFLGWFLLSRGGTALNLKLFFGDAPIWPAITGKFPIWDGIWPAFVGTLILVFMATAISLPLGLGCGIYLALFARGKWKRYFNFSLDLLAGVPSIVMGLFGFALILFLRKTLLPKANTCLFLASFCLGLLVLPYLIRTTQNAFDSLLVEQKLIGPSLGLNCLQNLIFILLPQASKGILSGIILAMGRAAEDTAVILMTGVVANAGLPRGLWDKFEALPFSIYYISAEFRGLEDMQRGFASCLILLALTSTLFLVARILQRWINR
ncbi:PstA family ABC transporter permease [Desulfovulcanus sp.]